MTYLSILILLTLTPGATEVFSEPVSPPLGNGSGYGETIIRSGAWNDRDWATLAQTEKKEVPTENRGNEPEKRGKTSVNPGNVGGAASNQDSSNRQVNAPVAGASSFTEGEAKSRIEKMGFADVTDLKKDDNGVWRGRAMKGGQMVNVSVDYQGNVFQAGTQGTTTSGNR